jgi:hypothetical protein
VDFSSAELSQTDFNGAQRENKIYRHEINRIRS